MQKCTLVRIRIQNALHMSNRLLQARIQLIPSYAHLFLADNNTSNEIIFPVTFDGIHSKSWGGTTFLVNAQVGGSMVPANFGIAGGWSGTRTTSAFVAKFSDITGATDKRAMFYTNGQNLDITDMFNFTNGYALTKWKNVTSGGVAGSDPTFPDTDWPVFRLADAYLIYAEAVLRGGTGGDATTALGYINTLRGRAYGNASGNIASGALTLDFVLDERSRELFGEASQKNRPHKVWQIQHFDICMAMERRNSRGSID